MSGAAIAQGKPGEALLGVSLPDGWVIDQKLPRPPSATGGNFSVGYLATNAQRDARAFVKAIDITDELLSGDPRALQDQTEVFNYERELLEVCRSCDRVVTAIAAGTIQAGSIPNTYPFPVFYLVFELAEGDARTQTDFSRQLDMGQALRTLHNVTVGLQQLHQRMIAHQDLKPSNVLYFPVNARGEPRQSKLADLGRAWQRDRSPPRKHTGLVVAGARSYAPPELLYRDPPADWQARRLGCDLYTLGSMIAFFFCGVPMTALLAKHLAKPHHWAEWKGFYQDVIPFVREAFNEAAEEVDGEIRRKILSGGAVNDWRRKAIQELSVMVRRLCDPDPTQRGQKASRSVSQFDLQTYVSTFDRLAGYAAARLI